MFLILNFCDWPTLVAVSHVDRAGRNRVRKLVYWKIKQVLCCYLADEYLAPFLATINTFSAYILGAVPWAIMANNHTRSSPRWPNNMHIATPVNTLELWVPTLLSMGYKQQFVASCGQYVATIRKLVRRIGAFMNRKQGTTIILLESRSESSLQVVLSGQKTSDMCILTPSRLFSFYPALQKRNEAILCRPLPRSIRKTWWCPDVVSFPPKRSCGIACPTLVRSTRGLEGVGEFAWGGLANEMDVAGNMGSSAEFASADLKWKFGYECHNPLCSSYVSGR
ncbi:hypothetical protein Hypma_014206 [Hypsizygus marmoreus]|uniref:Uncharacterized protein n=1 Tax=Hypsizygus marmoreus TaxID=39966 RepID=A0A369JCV7_HYPMA|nr:hypothetical protein Hypma_014206 [Hypsizygus marmoreus]